MANRRGEDTLELVSYLKTHIDEQDEQDTLLYRTLILSKDLHHEKRKNTVHLIFFTGNLLETENLAYRAHGFNDYVIFSSKTPCNTLAKLKKQIIDQMCRKIIVCTDAQRLADIRELFEDFKQPKESEYHRSPQEYDFIIWEYVSKYAVLADIKPMEPYRTEWLEDERVRQITVILEFSNLLMQLLTGQSNKNILTLK